MQRRCRDRRRRVACAWFENEGCRPICCADFAELVGGFEEELTIGNGQHFRDFW